MTTRIAILAACIGTLVLASASAALAINDPIPGVDIIVRKNPGGQAVRVGDCQAGGGRVVKLGAKWVCTGMRAPSAAGKQGRVQPDAGPNEARTKQKNANDTNSRTTGGKSRAIGFAPLKPAEF